MSHDEPRLQLHAYLKSLSGYRGAPLHVDLCFYVCNPKNSLKFLKNSKSGPYRLPKCTGAGRRFKNQLQVTSSRS